MEKATNILKKAIVDPAAFCVTWEQLMVQLEGWLL